MASIHSSVFTQYRSPKELFLFRAKKGNVQMEVYDQNDKLIKTQALTKSLLEKIPPGKPTKDPKALITRLLSYGYTPSSQSEQALIKPTLGSTFEKIPMQILKGHSSTVTVLAVLPGGCLASTQDNYANSTIKIWDPMQNFECIKTSNSRVNFK